MLAHLKRHYFFYVVSILLTISVCASYYRFLVIYDYQVRYEGECDPSSESCFVYCEDEVCTEPFYYTWITAPATLIQQQCGNDLMSCDIAFDCIETGECGVEYCDDTLEECSFATTSLPDA